MEVNKELKIIPPKGMEYYIENDTVKFRPIKKKLTYDDIVEKLFFKKDTYYPFGTLTRNDDIQKVITYNINFANFPFNCTSKKQIEKLAAYNKLMNVAKYLNGDWKPDWNNRIEFKYHFGIFKNVIEIVNVSRSNYADIYFKTKELAEQALEILGEETIKLTLSTDW